MEVNTQILSHDEIVAIARMVRGIPRSIKYPPNREGTFQTILEEVRSYELDATRSEKIQITAVTRWFLASDTLTDFF